MSKAETKSMKRDHTHPPVIETVPPFRPWAEVKPAINCMSPPLDMPPPWPEDNDNIPPAPFFEEPDCMKIAPDVPASDGPDLTKMSPLTPLGPEGDDSKDADPDEPSWLNPLETTTDPPGPTMAIELWFVCRSENDKIHVWANHKTWQEYK